MTYIVHRVGTSLTITIPGNSYYYEKLDNYSDTEHFPSLYFYEGDQAILQVTAPSDSENDGNAQIVTSSLITQFVFTSN